MKKIFVDIYLAFNLGDDLFLDLLVNKYPDSEITINYIGNNYDEFISKYNNVSRRKYTIFNKIYQRLKIKDYIADYEYISSEYDALVFIGGSIFREEEYHKSLYEDRMKMIKAFNNKGKKIFVIGSNFGPYSTEKFFKEYEEFYKLCDDVCFRDLYSYNLYKHLKNVRYAPDIVFQMDMKNYKKSIKSNIVGYSIIDVKHKDGLAKYDNDYINSTVKSIEVLTKKGYECCLMSFCQEEGDLYIIESIKKLLSEYALNNITVYDYRGNIQEAINLISTFKLFIAARFHANIIGLLCDVGILPIIYSSKTSNMLKDINLSDMMIEMENLDLMYDESMLEKAFNNKVNLDFISIEARRQFEKLDEFINNKEVEYL